jgi:hypothetical protein
MHIHKALADLQEIQSVFVRTRRFRLLRATIVLSTALLGIFGAVLQPMLLDHAHEQFGLHYVVYWSTIALIGAIGALIGVAYRYYRSPSRWDRELWMEAAWLFMPSLGVGAVITVAIATQYPDLANLLPSLWMLLFGLGVWSVAKVFTRAMSFVAGYYLLVGSMALLLAARYPFAPALMFCGFGIGQLLMGGVLAYDEKTHNVE